MTSYRTQGTDSFSIGSAPPTVLWTLVRGDTSAFRVYVTDEDRNPLTISEWDISMDIARRTVNANTNVVTYPVIVSLTPEATVDDNDGEFTVALSSGESEDLATGDIFDIQLDDGTRTWTVCKGSITVIEDVTGPQGS
jgi:hypothetical protein